MRFGLQVRFTHWWSDSLFGRESREHIGVTRRCYTKFPLEQVSSDVPPAQKMGDLSRRGGFYVSVYSVTILSNTALVVIRSTPHLRGTGAGGAHRPEHMACSHTRCTYLASSQVCTAVPTPPNLLLCLASYRDPRACHAHTAKIHNALRHPHAFLLQCHRARNPDARAVRAFVEAR